MRQCPSSLILLKIVKITFTHKQNIVFQIFLFSFILFYMLASNTDLKPGTPMEVKQLTDISILFSMPFQGNSSFDLL